MSDMNLTVLDNGPVIVKGEFTLSDPTGQAFPAQAQVALCRCGASQNKPFCDGAHAQSGFESAVRVPES